MVSFKKNILKTNAGQFLLLLYHRIREQLLKRYDDISFAKKMYQNAGLGNLNLESPKTFDEKLWWLKINYRDDLMTECTDKINVRHYVQSKGLGHILNEIYGVYDSPSDIEWEKLPDKFYLKTNHSSATNIFIQNKKDINKNKIENRLELFLRKKQYPLSREWNYKDIKPKIFAEKVLNNNSGLIDYRFLCSYGEVKGLFVDIETADANGEHSAEAKRNVYDSNFELLDVTVSRQRFNDTNSTMPHNIEAMKKIAEILSEPFPFCRIDLYNINGIIKFGEITFFHAGGVNKIIPEKYKYELGSWINISNI